MQFKLDRFETSLDLPAENEVKIKAKDISQETPESTLDRSATKFGSDDEEEKENKEPPKAKRSCGPRALRRRHGRKYEKKSTLQRKSSFNGHWYNRETAVFTPPKDSIMSIWATSLLSTTEILKMVIEKYQIESDDENYGLFVVKDSGERRLVTPNEFPLLLKVNLGPHEDVAKLQLMELKTTPEINPEVAQFLKFTYAECRAIVDMFYEEEEREIERIKRKYRLMRRCINNLMARQRTQMNINENCLSLK